MKEVKLVDFIKEISMGPFGSDIKVDNFILTGIPVLNGSNLTGHKLVEDNFNYISKEKADSLGKANARRGDIVITHRGTLGQVSFIPENSKFDRYIISQSQFRVRFNEKIDPIYFSYLMKSEYGQRKLLSFKNHVGVPALAQATTNFKALQIHIHDIFDQRKIAAVLSVLDEKIALNNQINAELEQMAKTLYDYWFVQFDFPNAKGKPYKSSGGKMVNEVVLKREIPEGWEVKSLEEVTNIIAGGDKPQKFSESQSKECTIPIYSNGIQNEGLYGFTDEARIKKQSVTISARGTIGYCVLRNTPFVPIIRLIAVTPKLDGTALFYYYCIKNFIFENSGSVQQQLTVPQVSMLKVNVPGIAILEQFAKMTTPLIERIENIKQQNQDLAALRDWLLPMLMNGQVKVSDNALGDGTDVSMTVAPPTVCGTKETLNIPANKKAFAKQVLAGKIVSTFCADPNFTDIKFQKIQFLAEHLIEVDLNLNYYYQAAGPYDNKFMHAIYDDFRKQKWFDRKNKQFIPLEKKEKIEGYYQGYFAPAEDKLNKLFGLLYPATEAKAEIIATLYAVWNNRILKGKTVTDEELLNDFYQWSDRKQQYATEQVLLELQWLRTHQMEPRGFGKVIKNAKNKK